MELVHLNEVFEIEYGNQLDFNKLKTDKNGINFVTRSRRNLGIKERVQRIENLEPYEPGLITVTLGGSYLLSAFVQPNNFYTAQNIKVLKPLDKMNFNEKVYYCKCLQENRFKYSSHGREANRSLDTLLIPSRDSVPKFINHTSSKNLLAHIQDIDTITTPYMGKINSLVPITELFYLRNGINIPEVLRDKSKISENYLPLIRPSQNQKSSYVEYVNSELISSIKIFPNETLYISTNGQGSHTYAYVSAFKFVPNSDITVLIPKRKMHLREKLFYAKAISLNRPNYSYGRKPKGDRLKKMMLPKYPPNFVFEQEITTANVGSSQIIDTLEKVES